MNTPSILDQAVDRDERICFGIVWFATEDLANKYAAQVRKEGRTYNGGFFHGMPCGRDTSWDQKDESGKVIAFAVTH